MKYPDGKIHVVNSKGRVQYYLRTNSKDKSGEYLSKRESKKVAVYLQKKYDEDVLSILNREINLIELNLKSSAIQSLCSTKNQGDMCTKLIRELYSDNLPEIKKKLVPIDISDGDYILEWLNKTFDRKPVGEDVPIFITDNGEHVRSKSELTIANALAKNGIPYRYEYPFRLSNGQTIYPDFTVLNIKTRREILWEHRGIMDDPDYAKSSVYRIKQLQRDGITIGIDLIITEETSVCPLGTDEIKRIIDSYF